MRVDWQGFSYESDWLPWRVTYSEKGLPYVHLEGLLMCAYWWALDCTGKTVLPTVGIGDTKDPFGDETYWYNFCQDEWVHTAGEAVYMVLGVGAAPRGIELVPFTKSSDGPTGSSYWLQAK